MISTALDRWLQPASAARSPAASRSRRAGDRAGAARADESMIVVMTMAPLPPAGAHSKMKPIAALIGAGGRRLPFDAVDAVEVAEEDRLRRRSAAAKPWSGRGERRARHRLDEIGRDDDDELGLVALEVAAAEERAEDRQLAEAGQPADRLADVVLEQAAEDHRAARGQLERGLGAADLEAGNATMPEASMAPSCDSSETSVLTRRLMRPSDSTTGVKPSATPNGLKVMVMLPVGVAAGRHRELAAGEEGGDLAGDRGQRRLGQGAEEAGLLERLDGGAEEMLGVDDLASVIAELRRDVVVDVGAGEAVAERPLTGKPLRDRWPRR